MFTCMQVLFSYAGKFSELICIRKRPSGQDRTAAKGKCRKSAPPQAENPTKPDSFSVQTLRSLSKILIKL